MKLDRILEQPTSLSDTDSLPLRAVWRTAQVNLWRELWEQARHSVIVVGWQLDSRIHLKKLGDSGLTETLRDKVLRLCGQNPQLHFYLLLWDHPVFYLPQRERLQTRIWEELHP